MNAPRLLTAPLIALALLGFGAGSACAATSSDPWPQWDQGTRAPSAVPFGDPFSSDPFYDDFFTRAQLHQEGAADEGWFAYMPLEEGDRAAAGCPCGSGSSGGGVSSNVTSSTSLL
ncbi:hypothetical protein AB0J38_37145 [Streptomyces sp. NPDC050095]|uniref:hypothetical protein n=1 Tax=unclassified Streptomyces TaxID=2593676 RepID=UPI0034241D23